MLDLEPPNADQVRNVVEARLAALKDDSGPREAISVEWRDGQMPVQVISMPLELLSYNPDTHRVRAQRTLDPVRDKRLTEDPYGQEAQRYLYDLLRGDPADPSGKVDPAFENLKEDLREHGQNDPGLIVRSGVLVNGNTRAAALRELGAENIRVGVLPADTSHSDQQTIELALQLRKDLKRDYSFMNLLLAIDERVAAGWSAEKIQREFRIQARTLEKYRWVLSVIRELIERSTVQGDDNQELALRLIDFERDQGKFDELHRAYKALKTKHPDEAEALREQRLLAILLDKSKTDARLIDADFADKYLGPLVPERQGNGQPVPIPGTSIAAPGPSSKVQSLTELTTKIAQARAVTQAEGEVPAETATEAGNLLEEALDAVDDGLEKAGKTNRLVKKRFGPSERLSDANEDLALALAAVSEARATNNFDASDLDEGLRLLRSNLVRLAQAAVRSEDKLRGGLAWLNDVAGLPDPDA